MLRVYAMSCKKMSKNVLYIRKHMAYILYAVLHEEYINFVYLKRYIWKTFTIHQKR